MLSSEGSVTFGIAGDEKLAVARYHEDWFTAGDPFRLAPPGQHDLLGADVSTLDVVDAPGVDVTLDQRYPMPDPAAAWCPPS